LRGTGDHYPIDKFSRAVVHKMALNLKRACNQQRVPPSRESQFGAICIHTMIIFTRAGETSLLSSRRRRITSLPRGAPILS